MNTDDWIEPFSIKILHNFLDDKYFKFFDNIIKTRNFYSATQGVNGKQVVQEKHKIRKDYTLSFNECSFIDKLILDSDCKCNLRERWRLLYYDGDAEKKAFRDAHTDWTNYSCHRRMSIIIGLSEPTDYEGGELIFPNNNLSYKIDKGSAVIFDSRLLHEVLPVTKGKRYVIQAFLFDESGWNIKKVQNGYHNFELKINNNKPLNTNIELLNTDNESISGNWEIYDNKNMVHSNIDSIEKNYLGNYTTINDVKNILKNFTNIDYFTWHKSSHPSRKWRGRLYGWCTDYCKSKNRANVLTWPTESFVVSGKKNITEINSNITILTCDGGPGNQIVGIKEGLLIANILNRKFIFPPIIQHYTINKSMRGSTENIKHWKFTDIFNYKNQNNELLDQYELLNDDNQTIYCTRSVDIDKSLRIEKMLDLKCSKKKLSHTRFRNKTDIMNLSNYDDSTLTISHLYNNVFISECGWNGCDLCSVNKSLLAEYKDICSNFDYSSFIKTIGDKWILENFKNEKFISLHMRYHDGNNKNIKDVNKLYNESDINNYIVHLCKTYNISEKNVFIASNKQHLINKSELANYKMLNCDISYNELESFIEQYICCMSDKFLYTGGIHAKPEHKHLRSTWSSFVVDYRYNILNKSKDDNFYLTNCFSESSNLFGYSY
tara:strand:- start:4416 stop:6398 length:1983 start_codon:yes stop_codon:yes gene_type:complete